MQQSSKILAFLYAVLGLITVPFGILVALFDQEKVLGSGLVVFYLCPPMIYLVIGYFVGLIGFWVYNVIASRLGGFEFELRDVE